MLLVWSHGEKLYTLMFARVMRAFHGDRDLAHDASVETLLAAARKGGSAFASEGAIVGYCLSRVCKMAIDLKRRHRFITGCVELIEKAAGDCTWEHARRELARAVAMLPQFERQIIDLYYFESLSDREIAVRLMRKPRGGDAHRKSIQRSRKIAERVMRKSLRESGLDYAAACTAIDLRNRRLRAPEIRFSRGA
jgi:DNA-directed RNA polymerase specialized sigma24 family protein